MNQQQRSFVKGAAILGSMGLVSKVFGAVYTIITTNILQSSGMAPYMAAFPVYTFLLAISSAGLPVAISKMVSERIALHDYRAAHMVFQTALKAMFVIGLFTTVVMMALSGVIENVINVQYMSLTVLGIAPSLFFVSLLSAYRGYFQGMMRMTPTAVSQIIEQLVKLGVGILLMYLMKDIGPGYGAMGAILGITVSEVVAYIYMLVLYNYKKAGIKFNIQRSVRTKLRSGIGRRLFYLAMPIVVGACAMPFVQLIDSAVITNTLLGLKSIILFGKEVILDPAVVGIKTSRDIVDSLFGLTSYINPIVNMPAVLSMALAMSLVPAISASRAEGDELSVSNKSAIGIKLSMLVGLPCGVGLFMLSTPIIRLLYTVKDPLNLGLLPEAGALLAIMGVGVFFLTVLQAMTGVLQGLGKTYIPVINLFIGIAVKIGISLLSIRVPEINIRGAFFGTAACYGVAAVLDVAFVIKYAHARLKLMDNLVKPLLSVAGMGIILYFAMPKIPLTEYSRPLTIALVALAVVVYLFFIFFFGALTKEDMEYIPGGGRLTSLMYKLRLWKRQ